MNKEDKIKEQAQYYLDNDVTMANAASYFGISKKTFQINMKKLSELNPDMYKLVQDKKQNNLKTGTIKGGKNGKPTYNPDIHIIRKPKSISDEQIKSIALYMVENNLTIREAESHFGISKSTLHNNLTKERLGEELYFLYRTNAEFNVVNTNKDKASKK